MNYQRCAKCGIHLRKGELKYIVSIHIAGDTDNVLPEKISDREIETLIEELKRSKASEVERDVYEDFSFVLCKPCKTRFARDPFGSDEDVFGGFQ